MKIILIILIAIPLIFYGVWIALPEDSMQSFIIDISIKKNLDIEVRGFKKGLLYTIYIDQIIVKSSGKELLFLEHLHGHINPLNLFLLRLHISFHGDISGGNLLGRMKIAKKKKKIEIDVKDINISSLPILRNIGINGEGTVSGDLAFLNERGRIEFFSSDLKIKQAAISNKRIPLQFFHSAQGVLDIEGNEIHITSVSLEGKDIYARLKGDIRDPALDLTVEIMPGVSFVENPFFNQELERYKVSPGYYRIPIKQKL